MLHIKGVKNDFVGKNSGHNYLLRNKSPNNHLKDAIYSRTMEWKKNQTWNIGQSLGTYDLIIMLNLS
jgi:hypothetical protein